MDSKEVRNILETGLPQNTFSTPESCPYCEGREGETPPEIHAVRYPGTVPNSRGWRVRVVPHYQPVLQIQGEINNRGLNCYDLMNGIGAHEILIEHPEHAKDIPDYPHGHLVDVLTTMQSRIADLKNDLRFRYVLAYKNYDLSHGIPHAFSQIIATPITPGQVKDELINARQHYQIKERCIFCDIIRYELRSQDRVVADNGLFIAFSPFASQYPFEIWLLPQQHELFFERNAQLDALADILQQVLRRIKRVSGDRGYTMVLHNGPNIKVSQRRGYWKTIKMDFHWHLEIIPKIAWPLKYEPILGFAVNPVPSEMAAQILRESEV